MSNSTEKIALHNLPDLKNTTDDALTNYLNSLKFQQTYYLQDVRLALGYGSFLVAALCFLWDYKIGFEDTKYYTAGAVVIYMLLSGALTVWQKFFEKDIMYQGVAPSGELITVATKTKKNVPIYNLTITVANKTADTKSYEIAKPFGEWFDEIGHFVAKPLQEILASQIPIIAKLDPKRVKAPKDMLDADPELLNAVLAASGDATGVDTGSSRRRKA